VLEQPCPQGYELVAFPTTVRQLVKSPLRTTYKRVTVPLELTLPLMRRFLLCLALPLLVSCGGTEQAEVTTSTTKQTTTTATAKVITTTTLPSSVLSAVREAGQFYAEGVVDFTVTSEGSKIVLLTDLPANKTSSLKAVGLCTSAWGGVPDSYKSSEMEVRTTTGEAIVTRSEMANGNLICKPTSKYSLTN
jgi:hypothetical protein